jgi:hypothetical protein
MYKRIAIAAAAALAACGGGSSWVDPTSGSFSTQDSAEVMGMVSSAFGAAVVRQPDPQLKNALTASQAVNVTQNCAAGGTVAVNGNMTVDCNAAATSCSFNGGLALHLNSCTSTTGYVGDGGLNIGASGSADSVANTFSLHETIQGGITVTHNGTVVGTCGINVTVDLSSNGTTETVHVNGTVCKQAVTQ